MLKKIRNVIVIALGLAFIASPSLAMAQTNNITNGLCSGAATATGASSGTTQCDTTNAGSSFDSLINTVITVFSVVVGAVSVIMLIYGGFRYITSAGNDSNMASARNTIIYALIGLVIVGLAQLIVHFVLAKAIQAGNASGVIILPHL